MDTIFQTEHFERLVISIIVVFVAIVILYFALKLTRRFIKPIKEKGLKTKLVKKVVVPFVAFIILIAIKLNLPLLLTEEKLLESSGHFLIILLIASGTWILINAIVITRTIILSKYDVSQKDNLQARKMHTQLKIIERIIIFILVFIAISSALMTFDSIRRLGVSLFASAGIAGLIIGLAAQKVIGSILAGFQIAITQPIRIEDVVIVENEWGWIEEISLTYVVVRLWDRRRLVVPSTYFIEKPFQNWTRTSADILGTVFIFTDYTMPVAELRKEFERILAQTELWDKNIAVVQVTNATNHSLEVRFLMSAADSPTLWDLRVLVREKIVEYLQRNHPDRLPKTRVSLNQGDETISH